VFRALAGFAQVLQIRQPPYRACRVPMRRSSCILPQRRRSLGSRYVRPLYRPGRHIDCQTRAAAHSRRWDHRAGRSRQRRPADTGAGQRATAGAKSAPDSRCGSASRCSREERRRDAARLMRAPDHHHGRWSYVAVREKTGARARDGQRTAEQKLGVRWLRIRRTPGSCGRGLARWTRHHYRERDSPRVRTVIIRVAIPGERSTPTSETRR